MLACPRILKNHRALAALLLLLALPLAGCKQHYAWHQEIRVTVTTPDGPVSGAAVQGVTVDYYPNGLFAAGNEVSSRLKGEAVVVDLGEGRYLFALLSEGATHQAWSALEERNLGRPEIYKAIEAQNGAGPMPVPPARWPQMVTFADITDPMSVALVDPDDPAASLGEGYALDGVTIAITDAPVTEGVVEGVLGWWLSYRGGPYNEMKHLELPNDSPRGWKALGASRFWSLDYRLELNEAYNDQ